MSSILSFQLRQQQLLQQNNSLPSPPNSFCEDEADSRKTIDHLEVPQTTTQSDRSESLQTVFRDMTLKEHPASMPENYTIDHSSLRKNSPIAIGTAIGTATAAATGGLTIRHRRQSETTTINRRKSRGLSESFNGTHRCNDCGKSYKHPNCLQKHKWEHSEEWELTSKLPLTKHQQVQMLEAAAILISMDRKLDDKLQHHQKYTEDHNNEEIEAEEAEEEEEEESIVIDDEDDDLDGRSSCSSEIFLEDL